MAREPSLETQLRTVKAELRRVTRELHTANQAALINRQRASRAEAEVYQWKLRFDLLLRRDGAQVQS